MFSIIVITVELERESESEMRERERSINTIAKSKRVETMGAKREQIRRRRDDVCKIEMKVQNK